MPDFRQVKTTGAAAQGAGTISQNWDSAPLAGSVLMIYLLGQLGGTPTVTGYTLLRSHNNGNATFYVWWKIATGSETAVAVNLTGSNNHCVVAGVEYTGVDTANPFDGEADNPHSVSGANITAPSVSPSRTTGRLVSFFGVTNTSAGFTPPAGMTERVDFLASTFALEIADQAVGAGATGTRVASVAGSPVNQRTGHSVVLRQANTAPGAPGVPGVVPDPVNTNGTISWTAATDVDADALTYDVELSTNNGGSWSVIAAGVAGLSTVYDFTPQPSTTTAKLRVRAKDAPGAYGPYATMAGTFTIQHNIAPLAPTRTAPPDGSILDRAVVNRLDWTVNDQAGDSQTKADIRWRLVGAPGWTDTTIVTTNSHYDVPGGTWAAGNYEWQVRTYDSLGVVGPYSSSGFFTAATAPAAPIVTTPINGSTVGAQVGVGAWSAPTQAEYEVRVVADNAGAPNTAVVLYGPVAVVSATARDHPLAFPVNGRVEHFQVRIRDVAGGPWSTWGSTRYTVSYTPPAVPAVTLQPDNASLSVAVLIGNPTPVGSQPAVSSNEVWRREVGDTGPGERLAVGVATNSTYTDRTPGAGGQQYQYQVVAKGANAVDSASAWTT